MAFLGSLSVFVETPIERPVLLQRRGSCWRRRAVVRSSVVDTNLSVSKLWGWREMAKGGAFVGFSGEMGKSVKAIRKSDLSETEVGGGGDVVGEDAEKAAIKKSKKTAVSSKNESMPDTGTDGVSSSKTDRSLRDFDLALSSRRFDGEDNKSVGSDADPESTTTKIPKASSIGRNGSLVDEEKEIVDKDQVKSLVANALGLSRESDLLTTDSKTAPLFLPKVSEPYVVQEEKLEELAEAYSEDKSDEQDADSEEGNTNTPLAGENVMNVILVSAECAPWSKTGGLGDVAGALPKALARRGHRVMVVAPRYGNYSEAEEIGVRKIYKVDGQDMEVTYHRAFIDGVDFVFMESAMFRNWENDIYGGARMDILKRMVLLCKAAVEVPWHVPCGGVCYGDGNLVFIANDWHTALLPVYLKAYYRDNGLMKFTRSVLVIHNIAHQGRGPLDEFRYLSLPDHYINLFKMYDPVGGEHCNIFAAGIKTADRVVTVSHGYAWELKTLEGGWGLHHIINENDWKLQGIVNGIDSSEWNPEIDVHLKYDGYTNYSLETLKSGKAQCKAALQREFHLPVRDDVPLLGFVGRLDYQKGVDIIAEAIPWMVGQDMQLILLGTGRKDLEEILRKLEGLYHDKVIGRVAFSVKMAHRITAGADILLMPSRFEPCGLNQLYAMIYGTIPVVHAVGGLRDTVQPFDPFKEAGLGWTFDRAEPNKLIDALGNCFNTYRNYKSSWEGLQRRGMTQDLSWDNVAMHYEEVLVAAKYQW